MVTHPLSLSLSLFSLILSISTRPQAAFKACYDSYSLDRLIKDPHILKKVF